MAQPITWQTINAPSFGEANRLMALAQQSILGAFDNGKTALADKQAFDKELWKRQDQEATQDALGKIYQAQTVDQLNALNQSGVLDQATAANGARIDRAAINALRDGRVATLQQREKQAGEFTDWTTTREQRPIVNGILTDIYSGNTGKAATTLAGNPNLLNAPEIQKTLSDYKRKLVVEGREDDRFKWDEEAQKWKVDAEKQKAILRPFEAQKAAADAKKAEDDLLNGPSTRAAQAAQTALARTQAGAIASKAEDEAAARQAEVDRKILATALKDNPYAGGVLTPGSAEELAKLANTTKLGSGGSPEKLAKTMERLTKIANEGIEVQAEGADGKTISKKIPVPLELAKAALLGSSDTLLSWNEGYADTFEETIRKRMGIVKPALRAPVGRGGVSSSFPALQNKAPMAVNPYAKGYEDYLKIIDAGASVPSGKKK